MRLGQLWTYIKKLQLAWVSGAIVFLHTYVYIPYLKEKIIIELSSNITEKIKDSLVTNVVNELSAKDISLQLKLSEQLNIPLHRVPVKIANAVFWIDSAAKYYNLVKTVEDIKETIDVGLKVKGDKRYYLSSDGQIYPVFEDIGGLYYYNKSGKKNYLENV